MLFLAGTYLSPLRGYDPRYRADWNTVIGQQLAQTPQQLRLTPLYDPATRACA